MKPTVGVANFGARQPYHLVIYSEKTSLADVLTPLCDRYDADLYLPSGEISDTLLYQMAKVGADDRRPMALLVLADFDPSGNQMAVSIGRKLQAFRDLHFPDLEFELHGSRADRGPGARVRSAVRLRSRRPSAGPMAGAPLTVAWSRPRSTRSPHCKPARADRDRARRDRAVLRLDAWPAGPGRRRTIGNSAAQEALDQLIDTDLLSQLRDQAVDKLAGIQAEIDSINETLRAETSTLGIELPAPIAPEPELPDRDDRQAFSLFGLVLG